MSKIKSREEWEEAWDEERLGFHLGRVHPALEKHYASIELENSSDVFLPLCGKSHDLKFFAEKGHHVAGVEYSQKALREFFEEREIPYQVEEDPQKNVHLLSAERFSLFHGDFFDLSPKTTGTFDLIYDRASILVFPPFDQRRYVEKLRSFLNPGGKIFLITLEFPDGEIQGPPYSTPPRFVETLFGEHFEVERLERREVTSKNDVLIQKGLSKLFEDVYLIEVTST